MMPSFDVEALGQQQMCKFDIYHTRKRMINGKCEKQIEYTPMRIDPDRLK
jgi:hypothetical protein